MHLKFFIHNKTSTKSKIDSSALARLRLFVSKQLPLLSTQDSYPLLLEFKSVNHQLYIKVNHQWHCLNTNQDIHMGSHRVSCEIISTQTDRSYRDTHTDKAYLSAKKSHSSDRRQSDPKEDKLAFLEQNASHRRILAIETQKSHSHLALLHAPSLLHDDDVTHTKNTIRNHSHLQALLTKGARS